MSLSNAVLPRSGGFPAVQPLRYLLWEEENWIQEASAWPGYMGRGGWSDPTAKVYVEVLRVTYRPFPDSQGDFDNIFGLIPNIYNIN